MIPWFYSRIRDACYRIHLRDSYVTDVGDATLPLDWSIHADVCVYTYAHYHHTQDTHSHIRTIYSTHNSPELSPGTGSHATTKVMVLKNFSKALIKALQATTFKVGTVGPNLMFRLLNSVVLYCFGFLRILELVSFNQMIFGRVLSSLKWDGDAWKCLGDASVPLSDSRSLRNRMSRMTGLLWGLPASTDVKD